MNLFKEHDLRQLETQYAVHHDEAQFVQTTQEAAAQLRELFEADVARRPRGFPEQAQSTEPKTAQEAAAQLRELFEADVARRPRGFPEQLQSTETETTQAATPE